MNRQKIGSQLDALGLVIDMEEGDRVAEAVVTVTTDLRDGGLMHHVPVHVPTPKPRPVPYPVHQQIVTVVEARQVLTEGQKQRVWAWLKANGIDPKFVSTEGAITLHSRTRDGKGIGCGIRYTEFCRDKNGEKFMDPGTRGCLTIERRVRQIVPLDDDPEVAL